MATGTAPPVATPPARTTKKKKRPSTRRHERRKSPVDRLVIFAMVAVPTMLVVWLVWLPALASVLLSFTKWNGFKLSGIEWIGTKNYVDIATIYPPFWPAIRHNLIWLVFLFVLPDHPGHVPRGDPRPRDAGQPLLPDRVLPARSCCRWRSSASSGSCSTPPTRG